MNLRGNHINYLPSQELPCVFLYLNFTGFNLDLANGKIGEPCDLIITDEISKINTNCLLPHGKVYVISRKSLEELIDEGSEKKLYWSDYYKEENDIHIIFFKKRELKSQEWNGECHIDKKLFVYTEWGWGDIIRNLRFLSKINQYFKTVIFEARKGIESLAALYPIQVVERQSCVPNHDFHIRLELIENIIYPFFSKVNFNIDKISYNNLKDVGIQCQGSHLTFHTYRDCPIDCFRSLVTEVNLWNFGKEPNFMLNPGIDFIDWKQTASKLANMDYVISVDTAIAHLAGILGIETLVLLPHGRFPTVISKDVKIWYPTMEIYYSKLDNWADIKYVVNKWIRSKLSQC